MRLLTLLAAFLWSFAALADTTKQPTDFTLPPGLVLAVDQCAPPVSPTQGQAWLVCASPSGLFAGHANAIVKRRSADWIFYPPGDGWLVYNVGTSREFRFDGSSWAALGVGASTNVNAADILDSTATGRLLIKAADTAAAQAVLGISIGSNTQAHSALLDDIAGITFAANDVVQYKSGHLVNRTLAQLAADLAGSTPAFASIELGTVGTTDTTLARSSAGHVSVESKVLADLTSDQTFTGVNAFTGVVNLNGPSVHLQRSGGAPYPFIYFDDLSASAPSGRWRMGTFLGEFDFQKNTDVTGNWGSVTNTLRCLQTDVCSFLQQPTVGANNILTTTSTDAVSNKTFDALNAASTTAAMGTLTLTDAAATAGPFVTYFRDSASPAAADATGALTFSGRDSAANAQIYGQFRTTIDDPTDGSEDYTMWFSPIIAGSGVGTNVALAAGNGVQIGTKSLVTTAGALGLAKISASGSAPGASGMKIEAVCGTNSGTLKLVAYAGTSNTASLILDNIGSGVSGC